MDGAGLCMFYDMKVGTTVQLFLAISPRFFSVYLVAPSLPCSICKPSLG